MADNTLKALVLYWSASGNTEKVAGTIVKTLQAEKITPVLRKIDEADDEELFGYDVVFLGCPSYSFLPPERVIKWVKHKMDVHHQRNEIKPGAPRVPGKNAVIFVTYSGPHTGVRQATPVGEYLGQLFEQLGFDVPAKWYVVGEFHNRPVYNTQGRLGDLTGRPNKEDLAEVETSVRKLVRGLQAEPMR